MSQTLTAGSGGPLSLIACGAVNASGTTLFIADFGNDQVQAFQLPSLTPAGFLGGFASPYALAVDQEGNLYVGEYGMAEVKKVRWPGGTTLATFGPLLGVVRGLALDPANNDLYVGVEGSVSAQVEVFQQAVPGTPVTTLNFPQISQSPRGMVKTDRRLYLADYDNQKIFGLNETGSYQFGTPQTLIDSSFLTYPCEMTLDPLGRLYVVSSGAGKLSVFEGDRASDPTTFTLRYECSTALREPQGLAVDGQGGIFQARNGVGGSAPWEVVKAEACLPWATATPSFKGMPPPSKGQWVLYPSPAKDHITAAYEMAGPGKMEIQVWNQNRERVAHVEEHQPKGIQTTRLNLPGAAPGVYFCRLTLTYDSGAQERLAVKKFGVIH